MAENSINLKELVPFIDDAISKGDRYVHLFIGEHGVSMYIYPHETGLPKWIKVDNRRVRCPECGAITYSKSPYCPICGEQLSIGDPICPE